MMSKKGEKKEELDDSNKLPPLPILPPPEGFAKLVHHVK
jgi:hypothetical protein